MTAQRRLRAVHVGVGSFGEYWCRKVLPHISQLGLAETVGVVDADPTRLDVGRQLLNLPEGSAFTEVATALDDCRPDFVTVVVPPAFHEDVVDAAVARHIHILSEKPIADTMSASVRIHDKVTAEGLKMAVTMSHRFDQDKQSLEQILRAGTYGPLAYLVYRFTHNCREFGSWGEFRHRIADPLLIEGTVHHFDVMRALCDADAATVYARTWNPPWGQYAGDSTALIVAEMTNGVRVQYEGAKANASTLNGWGNDYLRAECADGTVELDRRKLRVLQSGRNQLLNSQELALRTDREVWMNPWLAEQFCLWLCGGPAPATTITDNLQCAAFLFAAIESAHSGTVIDVQKFLAGHRAPAAAL